MAFQSWTNTHNSVSFGLGLNLNLLSDKLVTVHKKCCLMGFLIKSEYNAKTARDDYKRRFTVLRKSYAQVLRRHSNEHNIRRLFARDQKFN